MKLSILDTGVSHPTLPVKARWNDDGPVVDGHKKETE